MPPAQTSDDARLTDNQDAPETDAGPPKATARGRAAPERRCIATHVSGPQADMIRFVRAPDGVVTPDLAARLPGRGAWIGGSRASLETALRKGAFARAFKAQVETPADLPDMVDRLLARRLLDALGLATRAGEMVTGFDRVRDAIRAARPAALIEASDGADDGRGKVLGLARAIWGGDREDPDAADSSPPVIDCFSADELAMALGRDRVIHACLKQGRLAERVLGDFARLTGFRRVTPASGRPQTRRMGATPDPALAGSSGADQGADAGPQTMRGPHRESGRGPGRKPGTTDRN